MKKYILLINVIVGFACSSEQTQQEVIPSKRMVQILTEIHILESQVERLRLKGDSANKVYNSLELEIFMNNETNKVSYESSYRYYLEHPAQLKEIYSIVVDSLNVIQKRGYNEDQERSEELQKKGKADIIAKREMMKNAVDSLKKIKK